MSERKDICFSSREVAKYLGMGYSKLYSLTAAGEIPVIKFGRCRILYFRKDVIDMWLELKQDNPENDEKVSVMLREKYPWITIK